MSSIRYKSILAHRGASQHILRQVVRIASRNVHNYQYSLNIAEQTNTEYLKNSKRAFSIQSPNVSTDPDIKFSFDNMADMQEKACAKYADNELFGTRVGDKFEWITYREYGQMVNDFRATLQHKFGIRKGDAVAIISNNRYEWAVASYAVMSLGAVVVPMYEAQLEKEWTYIINDSEAKLVMGATESVYTKVNSYVGKVGRVESAICFDGSEEEPYSFKALLKEAKAGPVVPMSDISKEDISMIIYTSGTTGNPKGVELTHGNLAAVTTGGAGIFGDFLKASNRSLAFLPWAHVYGMSSELNSFLYNGSAMAIVPKREEILEGIQLAKPNIVVSVPALFNRIYDAVRKNLSAESSTKQNLVNHALAVARKRNQALEFGETVGFFQEKYFQLMDKIVLSKIRGKFGNLEYFFAGGAATSMPVLHFFEDIGIPILEGYGLTETSPIITASGPEWSNRRLGCVGVPIKDVDVMIVDGDGNEMPNGEDGEVTCSGPNVMKQYRNAPEANEEVFFMKNGKRYFKTGDMGRIIDGKFLKITGRIKEQYKLENGKYCVPAAIEDVYNRSPYILQSCVYGDNKPFNVILIVPEWLELRPWIEKKAAEDESMSKLLPLIDAAEKQDEAAAKEIFDHPKIRELIQDEIDTEGKKCKAFEAVKKWDVLPAPFTQDNHMLTPKMSVKRKNVLAAYMPKIEKLFIDE